MEVANFCAALDTLINQDDIPFTHLDIFKLPTHIIFVEINRIIKQESLPLYRFFMPPLHIPRIGPFLPVLAIILIPVFFPVLDPKRGSPMLFPGYSRVIPMLFPCYSHVIPCKAVLFEWTREPSHPKCPVFQHFVCVDPY